MASPTAPPPPTTDTTHTLEDPVSFIDSRDAGTVLQDKARKAIQCLAPSLLPLQPHEVTVVPSPVTRWRQRCRFGVAHLGEHRIGFFVERTSTVTAGPGDGGGGSDGGAHAAATVDGAGAGDNTGGASSGSARLIDTFPIASPAVDAAMQLLRHHLQSATTLVTGLCTVGIHGTKAGAPPDGDVVVSLYYDCPLVEEVWVAAADHLRDQCGFCGVVGRAKGTRLVSGRDYVVETLHTARGQAYTYRQTEGHFSNPNSHIAELTLDWLCEQAHAIAASEPAGAATDLLEMFCGSGNHTMVLAASGAFRRVVGVEINSVLVAAAQHNITANKVGDRCRILRAPSAKFVTKVMKRPSMRQRRPTDRMGQGDPSMDTHSANGNGVDDSHCSQGDGMSPADHADTGTAPASFKPTHVVDGETYNFRTVLVDPPRAGLDDATCSHVRRYRNILYISCNPVALKRDIDRLAPTHAVKTAAIFDHFPRTPHLETAVHLVAKPCWHEPA
eukprot:m.50788 g.50788  ORF g.50788 m.50788 type:complete len:500 (-) comp7264_c0_seq1:1153-2652(-)